jgi:hypothetical protein
VVEACAMDNRGQIQPATVPFNEGGYDFEAIPKPGALRLAGRMRLLRLRVRL